MVSRLAPLMAVVLSCLSGCATSTQNATEGFHRPTGNYRLVVMKPDISVSVLTAGGLTEPREDWTLTARDNILVALKAQQAKRGGSTQVVFASTSAANDDPKLAQLDRLHEAVGQSILLHKYVPYAALPTKKDKFDWTLGKLASDYGAASGELQQAILEAFRARNIVIPAPQREIRVLSSSAYVAGARERIAGRDAA